VVGLAIGTVILKTIGDPRVHPGGAESSREGFWRELRQIYDRHDVLIITALAVGNTVVSRQRSR